MFLKNNKSTAAFYNILNTKNKFYAKLKKTPFSQLSEVVYKINCKNCTKCYIGQTIQLLQKRIIQHRYDTENFEHNTETALEVHAHRKGHKFDFSQVTILDYEPAYGRRLISEMIDIRSNNIVNYREDVQHLSLVYDGLIEQRERKEKKMRKEEKCSLHSYITYVI